MMTASKPKIRRPPPNRGVEACAHSEKDTGQRDYSQRKCHGDTIDVALVKAPLIAQHPDYQRRRGRLCRERVR